MKIPKLKMSSQMAQIEIQHTAAKQTIRQPKAELSIQQPKAEVKMRTTPGKLTIDQTKAFADMNLMSIFQRNHQFASDGKQAALEGIERRARQGTELMKIEQKGNPLISQAKANAQPPMKRLGITFIPSVFSVKTSYQPTRLKIEVHTKPPVINIKPNTAQHDYEPGDVTTKMKQYQDLKIEVVNN
ncbi:MULTISPECIES: DUF6470 family protein [Clostridia]|uniref:DUF6470 family protein n=1 Tax=Clostridia TaxID=186801 RepID=UPI000EA06381|nr:MULTISPECIES: DUF6470 family protein [Clostridia]NBJ69599.1 hypothetical protein [Roseburia sp. 1XD42-34]RKI78340.1 hypothetical protein D7V87_09180 [Clostridium sp. 1xD42-85]